MLYHDFSFSFKVRGRRMLKMIKSIFRKLHGKFETGFKILRFSRSIAMFKEKYYYQKIYKKGFLFP